MRPSKTSDFTFPKERFAPENSIFDTNKKHRATTRNSTENKKAEIPV